MSRWKVTISGKGIRKASVEKLAAKLKEEFGEDASIYVEDATPPESRADRWSAITGQVEDARSNAEEIRDELQEWYDNLPEQFQSGDKGSRLEEAISAIEEFIDGAENIEGTEVEFPGMYE